MSIRKKIEDIAREVSNDTFRTTVSNKSQQSSINSTLAKVVGINGDQYIIILSSGETQLAYPGGSRRISIGQSYHLIGGTIF